MSTKTISRIEIVPAILETSWQEIEYKIKQVAGFSKWAQIDLCDGVYIPQKTWLPTNANVERINESGMPAWETMNFEFDLMVADYKKYIELAKDMSAGRIVCHLNTLDDIRAASQLCRDYDIEFGLSVDFATNNFEVIKNAIEEGLIDYVQVMGIETIGIQGQGFSDAKLVLIEQIANYLNVRNINNIVIQVDGGMTNESIEKCKNVGARRFAVGSYMFAHGGSIEEVYKKLLKV